MENSENPKFEESWKGVFSDAEANPPENVWTNIDLQLSRAESGDMKRRVIFYQRLAAAMVIFALALGSMGVWYWRQDVNQELAANDVNRKVAGKEKQENYSSELNRGAADEKTNGKNETVMDNAHYDQQGTERTASKSASGANNVLENSLNEKFKEGSSRNNNTSLDYKAKDGTTNGWKRNFTVEQTLADKTKSNQLLTEMITDDMKGRDAEVKPIDFTERPISLTSMGLQETEAKPKGKPVEEIESLKKSSRVIVAKADTKKKKNEDENWWASVGGSAGSYNTQASGASSGSQAFQSPSIASLNAAPISDRASVGTSFSFGMTFGKKVAQRWVVLSGVNYLSQSIGYNSNIAVVDANNQAKAYAADYATPSAKVTSTSPYTINSVSEFVSIPLQAGYLIVDRKIGVQLNTGIATDFFIKNTLTDESGKLSSYSESAGNNSYYRTLNWTGLVGTELSYKVSKHYRVSLVPGLRYSFNSVLKSSTGTTLNPMVWDVGFRFRYMF